ncbi:MAG: hypothetical protein CML46_10320 [Rhodobacteraceae bacterium]|nr:hypothetical protein [Paracoccaceae bacterium]MBR27321.1 hypothetical protein [Paracoccaceae bacterium]
MPRFPAAAARPFRLNRRGVLGAFAGGAAALALGPRSAAARLPEDVLREITARALDREILPAHAALSAAARRLAAAAATCPVEDRAGLDAAYHATFDAWMGVSHLRFGPAEAEGRALAIAFWPDRKGFARRALDGLIADQDPAVDDPARFHEVSVAARGLMALDRLLFDAQAPDAGRGYPCRLVAAIGRDLAATSAALEADWAETHAPDMRVAGTEAARLYLHAEEPVRDLFAALLTGARLTIDDRFGGPLGDFDRPRPRLAEAWRSGRSLRNARLSVGALRRLAACFAPALPEADAADLDAAWVRAQAVADRAPGPLVETVRDPGTRFAVEAAQQALIDARERTERLLAPALDLSVSFNALDGD